MYKATQINQFLKAVFFSILIFLHNDNIIELLETLKMEVKNHLFFGQQNFHVVI